MHINSILNIYNINLFLLFMDKQIDKILEQVRKFLSCITHMTFLILIFSHI